MTAFHTDTLREQVRDLYRDVARDPRAEYHFDTGRDVAELLGYPAGWLDAVPPAALDSFAGVGHFLDLAAVRPGEVVLDLGSGSGTDSFIAAHLAGPSGRVVGVDMTDAQLAKARLLRDRAGLGALSFVEGYVEEPPAEPESVDVVISNGVINLVPDKPRVFRSAAKALRPGGRLAIADIVSARPLIERTKQRRRPVGGVHRRRRAARGVPGGHRRRRPARRGRAREPRVRVPQPPRPRGRGQVRRRERVDPGHQAGPLTRTPGALQDRAHAAPRHPHAGALRRHGRRPAARRRARSRSAGRPTS